MRLLVDECCSPHLVAGLREQGHEVSYVPEDEPSLADVAILQHGLEEKRLIITEDHDFAELVFRLKKPSYGLVLLRIPHTLSRNERLSYLLEVLRQYEPQLPHHLTSITPNAVRIRALPD